MPGSTSSSRRNAPLWAVILAGGVGSRFWPVSTPGRPKQLLPLAGDRPLIAETLDRIRPLVPPDRTRILAGADLVDAIASATGAGADQFLPEPQAKGTAPVLAWAAHTIARATPDGVMASLHADHAIVPAAAFRALVDGLADRAAERDVLYTIGIEPSRPATEYGYIRLDEPLDDSPPTYRVRRFEEKPDRDRAERYLADGDCLWNSGIFVWRASVLLEELRRHTPELAEHLPLLDRGDVEGFFDRVRPLTIDEGLLERSDQVAVARATFQWDDVGAWDAVARTRRADSHGNVAVGPAHLVDARRCVVWSETDEPVVVFGADDLVVVRVAGATLVTRRDRAQDLKELLDRLPPALREIGS